MIGFLRRWFAERFEGRVLAEAARHPRIDPVVTSLLCPDLDTLLRLPPGQIARVYAPAAHRPLLLSLRAYLEAARNAEAARGTPQPPLREEGVRFRSVHATAVQRVLEKNRQLEETIRTLAWGLAARKPWRSRLFCLGADEITGPGGLEAGFHRWPQRFGRPCLLWWLADWPPPKALLERLQEWGWVLLGDELAGTQEPTGAGVVLDTNSAWIGRPDGTGETVEIRVRGSAARMQAHLSGRPNGAWHEVSAPAGFLRLSWTPQIEELPALVRDHRTAALDADGTGRRILVTRDLLPNPAPLIRWTERQAPEVGCQPWR